MRSLLATLRAISLVAGVAATTLTLYGCSSSSSAELGSTPKSTLPTGTGTTTSKSIGASGGTVSLQGATLNIPAGALSGSQTISITSTMDPAPSGVTNLSPVFSFGPSGITFKVPVTVEFAFTSGGTDPVVVWSDDNPSGFAAVATTISGDEASGRVTHFSEGFVADSATLGTIPTGPSGGVDSGVVTGHDAAGDEPDAAEAKDGGEPNGDATTTTTVDASGPGEDSGPPKDSGVPDGDSSGGSCAVCSNGICESACPSGTTVCTGSGGNSCTDLSSDSNNCGACGAVCASGQGCANGKCSTSCGASGATSGCGGIGTLNCEMDCPSNPNQCGNTCVDFQTDPSNCGACGTTCSSGEECKAGACSSVCASGEVCSGGFCGSSCAAGETACGGGGAGTKTCTSTQTDPNNCGGCGKACGSGQTCSAGACVTACGASSAPSGCGGTGGSFTCAADCPSDPDQCGSTCVNFQSDTDNCGGCGKTCSTGQVCNAGVCGSVCPGTDVCSSGACVASCPAGSSVCGASGSGVTANCTDTANDSENCGLCGRVCPSGTACSNGTCVESCGATAGADAGTSHDAGVGTGPDSGP